MTINLKYYNGTDYVTGVLRKWDGSNWVEIHQAKYWNGSNWVTIGTEPVTSMMGPKVYNFDVADGTPMSNYGWVGGNRYECRSGKLYCIAGSGWGYSTTFSPGTYTSVSFNLTVGSSGDTIVYLFGGAIGIRVFATNIQIRVAGSWAGQYSVDSTNKSSSIGLRIVGGNAIASDNGVDIVSVPYSGPLVGDAGIILIPGSDVTLLAIDNLVFA